ncbi:MAG TPA: aminotransferase class V-fold PLP-dependent enzyme, partial [Chthonomonadaceae bacterium]|nr:aminotransferase class V-fold PLP-dependent enzyme [Chthonomonadaceae bacterium]
TQVCRQSIAATADYSANRCANGGGAFETSRRTDATAMAAREAVADLLNAPSPETIVFGANMTTLTFALARSFADTIRPGDEIVVTSLDHDANVTPWTDLARRGAVVRTVDFDPSDCALDPAAFDGVLSDRTRLVAVTHASNAVGTVTDVAEITRRAHRAGALVFVDAVQYVPHGPVDVQALGCDFLACSAYKFFGPHVGILYGKAEHLEALTPYKVRPAPNARPSRWETGTPNYEGLAGVSGAIEYLASVGERHRAASSDAARSHDGSHGGAPADEHDDAFTNGERIGGHAGRRRTLKRAMRTIQAYEQALAGSLLDALDSVPGLRIYGIADRSRLRERGATVAFTLQGRRPREVAAQLGDRNIFCWSGNYYALRLMERLGLEPDGAVRVGLAHYNAASEIETLAEALRALPR